MTEDKLYKYAINKLNASLKNYSIVYDTGPFGDNVPENFGAVGIELCKTYSWYGDMTTEFMHESNFDALFDMLQEKFPDMKIDCYEGEIWVPWFHDVECCNVNTELVTFIMDIEKQLENYPLLNDEDFSKREFEAEYEYLIYEINSLLVKHTVSFDWVRPDLRQMALQFMLESDGGFFYYGELYWEEKVWEDMLRFLGLLEPDEEEFRCEECERVLPNDKRHDDPDTCLCVKCYNRLQREAGQLTFNF